MLCEDVQQHLTMVVKLSNINSILSVYLLCVQVDTKIQLLSPIAKGTHSHNLVLHSNCTYLTKYVVYFDQLLGAARTQKLVKTHKLTKKDLNQSKKAAKR